MLGFLLFNMSLILQLNAQSDCIISAINGRSMIIDDFDTVSFRFRIENPVIDGISFPTQGVCGLRLNFDHQNLSDLDITLTAPSGESVRLVGPSLGNTTIPSPIFPISHNVLFVPLSVPAMFDPDLSRDGVWDNDNPGWGPGPYGGSYYPYFGDLDSSFSGNVTGIWTVTFSDNFLNQDGIVREVELIFCDDRLQCSNCEAEAGVFAHDSLAFCLGGVDDFASFFNRRIIDTTAYVEEFLLYQGNNLRTRSTQLDLNSLDTGVYYITSVAGAIDQMPLIGVLADQFSYLELSDSLNRHGGLLCSQVGPQVVLTIGVNNDTLATPRDTILCPGELLEYNGQMYAAPDTIFIREASCDPIVLLRLSYADIGLNVPDTVLLSCVGLPQIVTAVVSGARGNVLFSYQLPDGFAVSGNELAVDQPGVYVVSASDDFCTVRDSFVAISALEVMNVRLTSSTMTLNCADSVATITPITNFPIDSFFIIENGVRRPYNWITERVTSSGLKFFEVYGNGGCMLRDSISFTSDFVIPNVNLSFGELNCHDSTTTLTFEGDSLIEYRWLMADMFPFSRDLFVQVSEPGVYFLEGIGENGCPIRMSDTVIANRDSIHIVQWTPQDMLTCGRDEIFIQAVFDSTGLLSAVWSDAAGMELSNNRFYTVTAPDIYSLTLEGTNGCVSRYSLLVEIDTLRPEVVLIGDSLNCARSIAEIVASTDRPNLVYEWRGPSIVGSESDSIIRVDVRGLYEIAVTDPTNNCTAMASLEVLEDRRQPVIILDPGRPQLTCDNPEVTLRHIAEDLEEGVWISPLGESQDPGISVTTRIAGEWRFIGFLANGCFNEASVEIVDLAENPIIDLPDSYRLDCADRAVEIALPDPSLFRNIEWRDDAGTVLENGASFNVTTPGLSSVYVEDVNGCSNVLRFNILFDTLMPRVEFEDARLTCAVETILLETNLNPQQHRFSWLLGSALLGQGSNLTINSPGIYTIEVSNIENRCVSRSSFNIDRDIVPPDVTVSGDTLLTCMNPEAFILLASVLGEDFEWTLDGNLVVSDSILIARSPGLYQYSVTGENACISMGSWRVQSDIDLAEINIDPIDLTCAHTSVERIIDLQGAEVIWFLTNGDSIVGNQVFVDTRFSSVNVREANGCEQQIPLQIRVDTIAPQVMVSITNTDLCDTLLPQISVMVSVGSSIVRWEFGQDSIGASPNIIATLSGNYRLTAKNDENGCEAIIDNEINVNPSPLRNVVINAGNVDCSDSGGFIALSFEGGIDPIIVLLNGIEQGHQFSLDNLPPGLYGLEIEDALGCVYDTLISIQGVEDIGIRLSGPTDAQRGETISLTAILTGNIRPPLQWFQNGILLANEEGSRISFNAFQDVEIVVMGLNDKGCIASDTLLIRVAINPDLIGIYVPNVISLSSSDPFNTVINTTLPEDVLELRQFLIFDRWGQRVHEVNNIIQRSPFVLWDGRMNDRLVETGVYVYYYEIIGASDGRTIKRAGDITVLR